MNLTYRWPCVAALLLAVAPALYAQGTANASKPTDKGDQSTAKVEQLGTIEVIGHPLSGYAANAKYHVQDADLGPLGQQSILDTPFSLTVLPQQFIVNQQASTVNDTLRYLPSVEIRDQQGMQVSRPQSRGFVGSIAQQTRLDGLNVVGTTAIPAENLGSVQVLNGLAGALYGPESPAGVFNYILKRPPQQGVLLRYRQNYDSDSILSGHLDIGRRAGSRQQFGYRFNLVHGEGQGYVGGSSSNRSLFSTALDYHFSDRTVIETNFSYYRTRIFGLPGSVVFGGTSGSTVLPRAIDPSRKWMLGQPGAGNDLSSATGLVKLKHDFGNGWHLEVGYLYQNAIRRLYGMTNRFTDNLGNYTAIKNFNSISRYRINSNMARLSGHVDLFGMRNDISLATNGFNLVGYHHRNSISQTLGTGNIDRPVIFPNPPIPPGGGTVKSFNLRIQSLIAGDTLHFNSKWALQGVLSSSFIRSTSFAKDGQVTKSDRRNGELSPTLSLIYKPTPRLTLHATWAKSVEEGGATPTGTVNAGEFLAPYHDKEYEIGAKFAVTDRLLLTAGAFWMTQPLATTTTANVYQVIGTQRDRGLEVYAQGAITPALSILGGVTWVDARVQGARIPASNGKQVIGVPLVKADISLDYHPAFFRGFAITGSVHAESRRAATIENNSYAPGYATYDLGVRYTRRLRSGHYLTARFQVINLTDVHYYSAIAGGNISGSAGANTAYFGEPKTFRASLEYDF